jgi:hypothetical protein
MFRASLGGALSAANYWVSNFIETSYDILEFKLFMQCSGANSTNFSSEKKTDGPSLTNKLQ